MEANDAKILSEFIQTEGPQYVIPVYQRHYTWDTKNVLRLLSDVKNLLDKKIKEHFIGNIVYVRKGEATYHEREIVDGQQRLTTVFLSLYVIRDIAYEKGDIDEAITTENLFLINKATGKYAQYKYKLKPNLGDMNTLQKIIDRDFDALKANKSALYRNYLTIYKEISSWIEEGYSIEEIRNSFDGLLIVWVALNQTDNAQQIFESINSTGEPLTAADLIRNYLLMNKDDEEQTDIYRLYWEKIEKNIFPTFETTNRKKVSKKIEEFFRFYLSSILLTLINIDQIYAQFKESWQQWKKNTTEKTLLSELVLFSKYWCWLFSAESLPKELIEPITIFRKIASNMPTPFLFGVFKLNNDGLISLTSVGETISLINTYLIRRHMNNLDTSSITRMFPTLLRSVITKCQSIGFDKYVDVVKYYLVNAHFGDAMYMPNDETLEAYMQTCNAYTLTQTKTFFDIYESKTISNRDFPDGMKNPIQINIRDLTVEHVMPQEATTYWLSKVSDPEKYTSIVNLLGNLTLADKKTNSKMSNKDFSFKKAALENVGRINMNKEIIEAQEWNEDKIKERTKKLIKGFLSTFPYFVSNLHFEDEIKPASFNIEFKKGIVIAKAKLYVDGTVEVLAGSKIRKCENRSHVLDKRLSSEIEDNKIKDEGNIYSVLDTLQFSSISTATDFIYGGSNNGWLCWIDEQGRIIDEFVRSKMINW